MKRRPLGAELFHTDGWTDVQTDMTKLIVAVRSFANGPETVIGSARGTTGQDVTCHVKLLGQSRRLVGAVRYTWGVTFYYLEICDIRQSCGEMPGITSSAV